MKCGYSDGKEIFNYVKIIPVNACIEAFLTCFRCLKDKPSDIALRDWTHFSVGFTELGLQVWCVRCNCNVIHIDFEGHTHPDNLETE